MSLYNSSSSDISQAQSLRSWAIQTLVNRDDYGHYVNGQPARCFYNNLHGDLLAHFNLFKSIGLYALDQNNQGKWITLDWDAHDGFVNNWPDVLDIYMTVQELGLSAYIEDSNGQGGFHLCIPFTDKIDGYKLVAVGKWLKRHQPEIEMFPAKATAPVVGGFFRLPGKHHKRTHVSKIWNGSSWVGLEHLLTVEPNDFSKVPAEALVDAKPEEPKFYSDCDYWQSALSWAEILEPHGWRMMSSSGEKQYWARPNVDHVSATTEYYKDKLYVFSSEAAPFEKGHAYRKNQVYLMLNGKHEAALELEIDKLFSLLEE